MTKESLRGFFSRNFWVAISAVAVFFAISKLVYNKIVDEEHFLRISHGNLEIAVQKRHDLNRQALESVTAYVEAEGRLLHLLIELSRQVKSGADAARIITMKSEIERLISSMDILVMASPDVMAKGPYRYLMDTYTANENVVTAARVNYNKSLAEFNTYIKSFPFNLVAWLYDFRPGGFFTATETARNNPDIDMLSRAAYAGGGR